MSRITRRRAAPGSLATLATAALVTATACGGTIHGTVRDFETGEPIVGATVTAVQHGWGISDGQLVWDKDRSDSTTTDLRGAFSIEFRSGSSVKLRARSGWYQRFEAFYGHDDRAALQLKRRVEGVRALPSGFLRVGLRDDGTTYGWDFSSAEIAGAEDADIFPVSVEPDKRGRVSLRALGEGGVRFVSKQELGVDDFFLVFTDEAPADGYADTVVLDFESGGGIVFVRTRDGGHFAKFSFTPSAFAQVSEPGVTRDLSLHYVYNPDGSRNLLYQMPE